jgi:quercetin dioxygenase-like cupin family protein
MPIFRARLGAQPTSSERIFRPISDGATSSAFENVVVAGAIVPWHQHAHEEVIVCLEGRATCTFADGAPEEYAAGDVVVIPANTRHSLHALTPLRQLSFFSGAEPGTVWDTDGGDVSS